jgi:DNA transposition AAA+ family ATPase
MIKQRVISELKKQADILGSGAKAARKAGISEATFSQLMSGTYKAVGEDIYYKIARALDIRVDNWQVLSTRNFQIITSVLEDSQLGAQFRIISERAGSGKTTAAKYYTGQNAGNTFYIQCREWSRTRFMDTVMRTIGLVPTNNVDTFIEKVSEFLLMKDKPLIIIDEADKLKPAALRLLIPLYNECEGHLGMTLLGTDNLEKELKRGVKFDQKGYDELYSRFGRTCVHLVGEDQKSVTNICKLNGITDPSVSDGIFKSCTLESVPVRNAFQLVVKDLRQLKSRIQGALLTLSNQNQERMMEAQVA